MFWDSPRARAKTREWFVTKTSRRRDDATTRAAGISIVTRDDDTPDERDDQGELEIEVEHLRRHVDALTSLCAEGERKGREIEELVTEARRERDEALATLREAVEERGASARECERLRARVNEMDEMYAKAKVSAAGAESRAEMAREALASAKARHAEALAAAVGERDECVNKLRVESERLESHVAAHKEMVDALERAHAERVEALECANAELREDVREYGEETTHLDEIIAAHEAQIATMGEEKRRMEKALDEMIANVNGKANVPSPFASSPVAPIAGGTPLAKAMRWIEDSFDAIPSPVRSPFGDVANKENVGTPYSPRDRKSPMKSPKSSLRSRFAPSEAIEAPAHIEAPVQTLVENVERVDAMKIWRMVLASGPESELMGRGSQFGAFRVRLVASVSCSFTTPSIRSAPRRRCV